MQTITSTTSLVLLEDEDLLRGLLDEWLNNIPELKLLRSYNSIKTFNADKTTVVKDANVIIADISLPDGDGLEAAFDAIEENGFKQGLVIISGKPTFDLFDRASNRLPGSWAFLLKNSNGLSSILQAIQAVQSGLVMVDPNLRSLFNAHSGSLSLTPQEDQVIAQLIFASEKTVERVLSMIYAKYNLAGTSKVENPRVRATLIYRGLATPS
jgi:DNA-binding NarL/FixJ family response regulator